MKSIKKQLWVYFIIIVAMIGFFFVYNTYFKVWNNHNYGIFLIINLMYWLCIVYPAYKFTKLLELNNTIKLQNLLRENEFVINDEEGVIGPDTKKAVKQLEEKRNHPFKTTDEIITELKKRMNKS